MDKRIFENGYRMSTDYAPDRANGCLIGFCWAVVVIVLSLAVLGINGLMGNVISILVSLERGA